MNRLKYLLRRTQFDRDLDQEIQFHIERRAAELQLDAMHSTEATSFAQREFGSVLRTREDSRRAWRFCWLEDFAIDLQHGIRIFRREPGVAAAAILSLALG
ncbi:MAG: permease prefix domain 1-containing protein, partial [Bryobacteraceae bacterium]